jgi:hypothetical protein
LDFSSAVATMMMKVAGSVAVSAGVGTVAAREAKAVA